MTPYDLSPTARLEGIHMVGTVARRLLISYPVPPEALARFVPPGAELSLFAGKAWVSACFVRMDDMRPSFAGRLFGLGYRYLIHRTRARLPFPDGKLRECVLVLEPNMSSRLLAVAGSKITKILFQHRDIRIQEDPEGWTIQMRQGSELLYDATVARPPSRIEGVPPRLPEGSCFRDAAEADGFLLGVSYGGQWVPETQTLSLLPETHEPWETLVTRCETRQNRFLDDLGCGGVEADHGITMAEIPHWFGVRPVQVRLASPESGGSDAHGRPPR